MRFLAAVRQLLSYLSGQPVRLAAQFPQRAVTAWGQEGRFRQPTLHGFLPPLTPLLMIATAVGLSSLTLPNAASAQVPEIDRAAQTERPSLVGPGDERPAGRLGVGTTSAVAPMLEPTPANTFTRAGAGLTGVAAGSSSLGDVNNDGHLDLVVTGEAANGNPTTKLYLGDGQGGFTDANAGLTAVGRGSSSLGDVNNDGNLDLMITGVDVTTFVRSATLYLGDGRGGFADANAGLEGVGFGASSSFGDVNNDGNLDLVITGENSDRDSERDHSATLYLGDGTGDFTNSNAGLEGVRSGPSSSFGDVNNDGNLDLVITGYGATGDPSATLYLGDGTGGFSEANAGLTGVYRSSLSLGDVNNDGNLDLVITGLDANSDRTATLYLGDGQGGFTDANAGLTGVWYSSSSLGDVNGDGNADLFITGEDADNNPMTTLYLGDGTGGFTDANAGLTSVYRGSSTFGDVDGDGDIDLVVTGRDNLFGQSARVYINRTLQEPPNQLPVISATSSDGTVAPGLTIERLVEAGDPDGDRLTLTLAQGSGTNGVSLTDAGNGLAKIAFTPSRSQAGQSINFTVEARDGSGGTAASTPITVEVGDDFGVTDAGLAGVSIGTSSSFGDVNGDGNLDLVTTGYEFGRFGFGRSARLYLGDGQGGFTNANAGLTGVSLGSSTFGDVDNDGDLDLLITGDGGRDDTATLYLGDGEGGFTDANAGLTGVARGSSTFGDVDNDGNLDLLITGEQQDQSFNPTATLYLGDGQGGFTDANAGLSRSTEQHYS